MKILTVVYDLKKGGTQRAAQNFAEAYFGDGHDSRVWAPDGGGVREVELRERGVQVWSGRATRVAEAIQEWTPDVIHLHSLGLEPEDVQRLKRDAPAATVLETNVFSRPSPWVSDVDVSFQLSRWCEWLYQLRGGPVDRTAVVPVPIRTSGFHRMATEATEAFRHQHGIRASDILLGRIGQFYHRKWSPLLLDTFEHAKESGVPAKLLVVNAPPSILDRCAESRWRHDIVVIDEIIGDDAMSQAYSAIDVFVHAADQGESFGLVLTEAMLCETPVVAMSTPWEDNSQPEVVGNMVGGLVATTRRGFMDAVVRLCRDEPLRRQLGRQGRERVIERYDSREVAREALRYVGQGRPLKASATCDDIMAIYGDAVDSPSWLTAAAIKRLRRLQLSRYTTGYEPWSRFVRKCVFVAGRRLGLWPATEDGQP
jgi:glycosyltransferase involved in cell wall biosynthesis